MPKPVIKTIDVKCTPETAFRIFTDDINTWWPLDRHSVSANDHKATARSIELEQKTGGAITEIGHDGTRYSWGSVKTWAPFSQLTLNWHINRPPTNATMVDVKFEPIDAGTRVTLTHSNWEVLGDTAQAMRDGYDQGWVHVFETCFGGACAKQKTSA